MKSELTTQTLQPRITFQDTNVVGNVYFLTYFRWQFECCEEWLRQTNPTRWRAIRSDEQDLIVSRCSMRFDDPFGATIGDQISVDVSIDEKGDDVMEASTVIVKHDDSGESQIASGTMLWTPSLSLAGLANDFPSGPCYSISASVPRGWELNPLDLLSWQGKCRELFLADHAPESLRLVATRDLALQTTSASLNVLDIPEFPVDHVRVELRLETIKCGQMGVRFDYYAESDLGPSIPIARGQQRMSSKRWNGSALVPSPFRKDLIEALGRFTESQRMLQKIDDILEFLQSPESQPVN